MESNPLSSPQSVPGPLSAPAFREIRSSAYAYPLAALVSNQELCCFSLALFFHPRCFLLFALSLALELEFSFMQDLVLCSSKVTQYVTSAILG